MKTPDAISNAIDYTFGLEIESEEKEIVEKLAEKWFSYGEAVSLEIDTEKETCTVLKR
jgi:hypothetical protein